MKENNAWIDQVSFGNKYYNAVLVQTGKHSCMKQKKLVDYSKV